MNTLLIYPAFPDTFWSFKHALRFIRKKAFAPPLGLLTVAAMLPPEWEKQLVDLNVTRLAQHDLAWADYVFISAMIGQRETARAVIARCEQAGVPVVVDAGLGLPSHAAAAMELGADACLVNTAIAIADDPVRMARAFAAGLDAGRQAYLAGAADESREAQASSPLTGLLGHD